MSTNQLPPCSFCKANKSLGTAGAIAGPDGLFICPACIEMCVEIIRDVEPAFCRAEIPEPALVDIRAGVCENLADVYRNAAIAFSAQAKMIRMKKDLRPHAVEDFEGGVQSAIADLKKDHT